MRVLVACEFSGRVRDAFIARGHDAMSCDLLDSDSPGPHHKGNVLDILGDGWDLMIAHPPCTYLAQSGVRWLHTQPGRWDLMREGAEFFRTLLECEDIPRRAIENPVMHGYGLGIIGGRPDQIVHPWQFGHAEKKATGLWLRGLPRLVGVTDLRQQMASMDAKDVNKVHRAVVHVGTPADASPSRDLADEWGAGARHGQEPPGRAGVDHRPAQTSGSEGLFRSSRPRGEQ